MFHFEASPGRLCSPVTGTMWLSGRQPAHAESADESFALTPAGAGVLKRVVCPR